MKINPLSAAIGFALIDHDLLHRQAPGRGAMSTATPAGPSAIGPHLAQGQPRGGTATAGFFPLGNGEGVGHD